MFLIINDRLSITQIKNYANRNPLSVIDTTNYHQPMIGFTFSWIPDSGFRIAGSNQSEWIRIHLQNAI